jgi:hypothetical protein
VLFGAIWKWSGAAAAFGVGGALALAATALLFIAVHPRHVKRAVPSLTHAEQG